MANMWILAQSETQDAPSIVTTEPITDEQATTIVPAEPNAGAGTTTRRSSPGNMQWIIFAVLIIFVWMFLFRGPKKKQREHKNMVQSLQKNDRIRTIGGIFGTVVDIKDDEITLKIDESNNTKIKISPNAVGTKIADEKV